MCDCEPAAVYNETYRKARKAHWCCECGADIKAGDVYQYTSGVSDHQGFSEATCLECAQVRDWVRHSLRGLDCGPCLSQLYDEWPRDELPPHVREARAILRAARLEAA